jgi:hypothetical protein
MSLRSREQLLQVDNESRRQILHGCLFCINISTMPSSHASFDTEIDIYQLRLKTSSVSCRDGQSWRKF